MTNRMVLYTKEAWRKMRDMKMCEHFTDEELENADKKMVKIKTGWCCGVGVVDFWIDPKLPTMHIGGDADDFKLSAGYSK